MTCVEAKELIPLLAGNDLDGAEAAGVREHIAACATCRAEYEGFAACLKALALAAPANVPESVLKGFWEGVETGISRKDEPSFHRFRHVAAAAAVLLLGIGVGFLAFRTFQHKSSSAVKPAAVEAQAPSFPRSSGPSIAVQPVGNASVQHVLPNFRHFDQPRMPRVTIEVVGPREAERRVLHAIDEVRSVAIESSEF